MEQDAVGNGERGEEIPENLADVSLHIRGVLEAAERAAADTIEQARAQGERRLGEAKQRAQESVNERNARIRDISDDLLRQAGEVEARLVKLDHALGTAMEELRRELGRLPHLPDDDDDEDEDENDES